MIFSSEASQTARRLTGWFFALMAIALWTVTAPALAWAGDDSGECDDEKQSPATSGLTPIPVEPAPLPCQFEEYDSPSYNVCFVANPQPMSTMPKWITRQQARDAVGTVLEEVHALHRPSQSVADLATRPLWQVAAPGWLDEVIEDIQRTRVPVDRGSMCIDAPGEENCERMPTHAVTGSATAGAPVFRWTSRFDVPWRPDDNAQMQSPLVDLRVGPAAEHRPLPDRPPPA